MRVKDRRTAIRRVIGTVLPLGFIALTVFPLFVFQDRLPEPIATHWGWSGNANDSMSFGVLLIFSLVFVGVPALGMSFVAHREPSYRGEMAPAVSVTAFISGLVAAANWWIVGANLDALDWSQASPVGFIWHGLGFSIAATVAAVAGVLARSIETERNPEPVIPSAGLPPGGRAVWMGTARASWALPIMAVFTASGVAIAFAVHPLLGIPFVLIGLSALSFASVRVIVDRFGVRVDYGPLAWPTQRVPLADIRQASAVEVVPMQRGGWGYRGSLRLFGRAAIVLRGGDGIELDLVRDRKLTITVDDAAEGAGVLNDLIAGPAAP